jgi:hypothetical protein
MAHEIYPPTTREQHGLTVVTPKWRKARHAAATALQAERAASEQADTFLLVPAAQHPLEVGRFPGEEFTVRLGSALQQYDKITSGGGKAEFFLPGNRHHDGESGKTDLVALYDAAGEWLVDKGVPPERLHGLDWIEQARELVYNGADELRVAAWGFANNVKFRYATYFCSPGQRTRAETYALAFELPVDIVVPEELLSGEGKQFHDRWDPLQMGLRGATRAIDPYGDLLAKRIEDRVPADLNTGTTPDMLPFYSHMPWYGTQNQK